MQTSLLSLLAVWTELGDRKFWNYFVQSRNAAWREFCLVSTQFPIYNWDLFAKAFTSQTRLDETFQCPLHSGLLKTVMTCCQFCSQHRQVLSCRWCELGIRHTILLFWVVYDLLFLIMSKIRLICLRFRQILDMSVYWSLNHSSEVIIMKNWKIICEP